MNETEKERLFVELFTGNRARLLRLCRGYLAGVAEDEAEDLLQDIMVNVWKNLDRFRGDASINTWLYRIAVNTALLHRERGKRARAVIRLAGEEPLPEVIQEPSAETRSQEQLHHLHAAIAELPPGDRLIVSLVLEGLGYREIADVVGITVNHAGVRIFRLKRSLEKRLRDAGHEL